MNQTLLDESRKAAYGEDAGLQGGADSSMPALSASRSFDPATCSLWKPMYGSGIPVGVALFNPHPWDLTQNDMKCRGCAKGQSSDSDPLFQPCNCGYKWHRSCFKENRVNNWSIANYWSCRECMYNYRIERIGKTDPQTEKEIRSRIRCRIAAMWLALIFIVAASVSVIASIAWASDKSSKNIPVFVKTLLTSVVMGFPNSNSTKLWREEFKDPDVHVFQYYGVLGAFIVSILVLILSCFTSTESNERSGKGCCGECYCASNDSNDSCFWCCYWSNYNVGGGYGGGSACCDCGSCDCGDCSMTDCKLGGDAGEAIAIVIVVVVVIVLVSAIFVAIGYAVRKSAQLHDSVSHMLASQAREIENQTVVLGKDEFVRPLDAV